MATTALTMPFDLPLYWALLKKVFANWIDDDVPSLGKALIGIYIGSSGIVSGFGAAGSLVVVLLWVYYSAQVFLMGAEFTWVYANLFGSRRMQAEHKTLDNTPI